MHHIVTTPTDSKQTRIKLIEALARVSTVHIRSAEAFINTTGYYYIRNDYIECHHSGTMNDKEDFERLMNNLCQGSIRLYVNNVVIGEL